MAPRKITVPGPEVPLLMSDSTMNPDWYPVFKFLETLQPLSDIAPPPSFTVPAISVGNTTTSITNRFVSVDNGGLGGTDTNVLGVGTGTNPQQNSWATTANVINQYNDNHNAHKNAADALNTRVTALESKINAVISDLDARFP